MPEITLLAHNIRSAHNVGSLFRTADGLGVHRIILSGYSPYPHIARDSRLPHEWAAVDKKIHKTALGAETTVPFERCEELEEWMDRNDSLASPLPVFALEQAKDSVDIGNFKPPHAFALLIGEEVHGIESLYLQRCSGILEIPMHGEKESFNVAVAAAIALYVLSRT